MKLCLPAEIDSAQTQRTLVQLRADLLLQDRICVKIFFRFYIEPKGKPKLDSGSVEK